MEPKLAALPKEIKLQSIKITSVVRGSVAQMSHAMWVDLAILKRSVHQAFLLQLSPKFSEFKF